MNNPPEPAAVPPALSSPEVLVAQVRAELVAELTGMLAEAKAASRQSEYYESPRQFAQRLGVSVFTVQKLVRLGAIPKVKLSGTLLRVPVNQALKKLEEYQTGRGL